MTSEPTEAKAIVLRDEEGALYRRSLEALAAFRVPEEEKAALEEALDDDTVGYFYSLGSGVALYLIQQENAGRLSALESSRYSAITQTGQTNGHTVAP